MLDARRETNGSEPSAEVDELAAELVDAAGVVRKELGVGLKESIYQAAFEAELASRSIPFERKPRIPVVYRGVALGQHVEPDLVVDSRVVVELKAVLEIHPVFYAQTLTYLRYTGCKVGLLINFYAIPLGTGIHRLVL